MLPPAGAGEHPDDLVANLLRVGVEVEQDARRDALVLTHEPEQDVLGTDVVVAEGEGLAQRELEHLLRARRERDLTRRHLVALADDPRHLGAHLFHRDVQGLEHARSEPFLFPQQSEQDVLGADVVVLQGTRLVLREYNDLTSPLGESFEQRLRPSFRDGTGGRIIQPPGRRSAPWYRTRQSSPIARPSGGVLVSRRS